ncbi:MAG TPA: hypothetical protein VK419_07025 [Bryobacteraceae bacterium]|nr:hypothetical protein [Bryobacteraceae bacterium]
MKERIERAVRNNADWCDLVCSAHGSPGVFADGMWINRGRIPRFYPNAQTIAHDAPRHFKLIEELSREGLPIGWALKDSFASLDLTSLGFTALFEAQWIILPREKLPMLGSAEPRWKLVCSEDSLAEWERAWRRANGDTNTARIFVPALLDTPDVAIVAGYRGERIVAGAIGNRSEGVLGWSNFFAAQAEDPRACASGSLAALSRDFADAAIVGYEEGTMLRLSQALSFESIGPLRVWLFNGR